MGLGLLVGRLIELWGLLIACKGDMWSSFRTCSFLPSMLAINEATNLGMYRRLSLRCP